jgi:hypothetical protein
LRRQVRDSYGYCVFSAVFTVRVGGASSFSIGGYDTSPAPAPAARPKHTPLASYHQDHGRQTQQGREGGNSAQRDYAEQLRAQIADNKSIKNEAGEYANPYRRTEQSDSQAQGFSRDSTVSDMYSKPSQRTPYADNTNESKAGTGRGAKSLGSYVAQSSSVASPDVYHKNSATNQPHTSTRVRAPPGGASSITFG